MAKDKEPSEPSQPSQGRQLKRVPTDPSAQPVAKDADRAWVDDFFSRLSKMTPDMLQQLIEKFKQAGDLVHENKRINNELRKLLLNKLKAVGQPSQPSQPSQPKAKGPAAKASASSKPEASKADIDRLLANAETLAWPAFWEVLSQFQQMQDSEANVAEYKGKLYNEGDMKVVEKGLNVILRKKHK